MTHEIAYPSRMRTSLITPHIFLSLIAYVIHINTALFNSQESILLIHVEKYNFVLALTYNEGGYSVRV